MMAKWFVFLKTQKNAKIKCLPGFGSVNTVLNKSVCFAVTKAKNQNKESITLISKK